MRTITDYTKKPKSQEVIVIGDRATVFVRKSIKSYKDEEGETRYTAIEYSTQVKALGFKMSDDFEKLLIQAETDAEAARVRARSDAANALNTLFFFMFFPLFYLTFINFFNECVTRPLNCKYDQDDDDG